MVRKLFLIVVLSATAVAQQKTAPSSVCESCLKSEVQYLASDALRGRGSGTEDELTAANHVAQVFKKLGLQPVGGRYILPVTLERTKFTAAPSLRFTHDGKQVVLSHGKEMLSNRLSAPDIKGKLFHARQIPEEAAKVPEGSIVVLDVPESSQTSGQKLFVAFLGSKASAVLVTATSAWLKNWDKFSGEMPTTPANVPGESPRSRSSLIAVKPEAMALLKRAPDGTEVTISGPTKSDPIYTRNAISVLRGSDPKLKNEYVMFSAHMDHLGVRGTGGDTINNGADDDASGTSMVLELARIFSKGARPKRSILFVAFGSEELGLLGSKGFAANPPVPLGSIVADIEFEQTGLPQEKMDGHFWMTGSQLSDLRSQLEQHGSVIGDDPYPGNPFFRASDNYSLASKGVVAHTVSGAAEFPDYHQPGDEANKLNYGFMAKALEQALPGFRWLVNSDAKPAYLPGKNPSTR